MSLLKCLFVTVVLLALSILQIPAQVLFSDGFEGYTAGNNPLDKNYAGPNAAPNGSGNPWYGPGPPNLRVVGTTGSVNPHSGNNMVTASAPSDLDQEWVNLAYRVNGGANLQGSFSADWWFYDPLGAGGSNYRDYGALGYYSAAPTSTDYPGTGSLNGGSVYQRLSLGASNPTGFNANDYQARVVGASDGVGGTQWFNVGTRSVGWHEAEIVLGAPNGASTLVSFYIDGVDVLDHAISTSGGVNVLELNAGFGSTPGFYDDVSVTEVPEPSVAALLFCGGLSWLALRRRK